MASRMWISTRESGESGDKRTAAMHVSEWMRKRSYKKFNSAFSHQKITFPHTDATITIGMMGTSKEISKNQAQFTIGFEVKFPEFTREILKIEHGLKIMEAISVTDTRTFNVQVTTILKDKQASSSGVIQIRYAGIKLEEVFQVEYSDGVYESEDAERIFDKYLGNDRDSTISKIITSMERNIQTWTHGGFSLLEKEPFDFEFGFRVAYNEVRQLQTMVEKLTSEVEKLKQK